MIELMNILVFAFVMYLAFIMLPTLIERTKKTH